MEKQGQSLSLITRMTIPSPTTPSMHTAFGLESGLLQWQSLCLTWVRPQIPFLALLKATKIAFQRDTEQNFFCLAWLHTQSWVPSRFKTIFTTVAHSAEILGFPVEERGEGDVLPCECPEVTFNFLLSSLPAVLQGLNRDGVPPACKVHTQAL